MGTHQAGDQVTIGSCEQLAPRWRGQVATVVRVIDKGSVEVKCQGIALILDDGEFTHN